MISNFAFWKGTTAGPPPTGPSVSDYAVPALAPINPKVVADFVNEFYWKSGSTAAEVFEDVLSYTSASEARMMHDSAGALKWSPHNYFINSSDMSGSEWAVFKGGSGTTPTKLNDGSFEAPDGSMTATRYVFDKGGTASSDTSYISETSIAPQGYWTLKIWMKSNTGFAQNVLLYSTGSNKTGDVFSVSTTWELYELDGSSTHNNAANNFSVGPSLSIGTRGQVSDGQYYSGGDEALNILVWGAQCVRRDSVAGSAVVADNPDAPVGGNSDYVPTTSAIKFVPRRGHYTFNGISWENKGLLIESEERTNLSTSGSLTGGAWSETNMTTPAADAVGVNGVTNSAVTLKADAVGGTGAVYSSDAVTVSTSTAYTFSIYCKSGTLTWAYLSVDGFTTPANGGCYFNLGTPEVGTEDTGIVGDIIDLDGWCRCSITFTTGASVTTGNIRIGLADADTDSTVARNGTSSIITYGPQFEAGKTATSYIQTQGTGTVTRASESLVIDAASMSSGAAMSLKVAGEANYANEGAAAQVTPLRWYNNATNYISVDIDTDSTDTGQINANQSSSTLYTSVAAAQLTPSPATTFNVATRHTSTAINVSSVGTSPTETTAAEALPTLTSNDLEIGQDFNGTIAEVLQYDSDVSDAGIDETSNELAGV